MIPIAAGHPSVRGNLWHELANSIGKFLRRVGVAQIDARKLKSPAHEVHMSIVEARQDQPALSVDDFRRGSGKLLDVTRRTNCNYAVANDCDRRGRRLIR